MSKRIGELWEDCEQEWATQVSERPLWPRQGGGRGRESEGAREPPSRAVVGARKFLGPAF